MKPLKRIVCLFLSLLFVCSVLASCGGDETNGGDGTTVAPCETHTLPAGLCTDAKTCTVCGTVVEGTAHTYAEGSLCTEARSCTVCNAAAPVNASHTAGPAATCGTDQLCVNCDYMFAERTYRHGYKDGFCEVCGQPKPWEIETISIGDTAIKEFKIVTPNKTYYESYLASLIQHRVHAWHGVKLEIVTDKTEKSGHEIRIGNTSRTVSEIEDNQYLIREVDGDLEILCGNMYAYEGVIKELCDIFKRSNPTIEIAADQEYTASYEAKESDALDGDVRIMIHNVLQYVSSGTPNIASRYSMFRMLYDYYQPDVIGMQEANSTFFNASNGIAIKTYLLSSGYVMLNDNRAQPIFYKNATLELLESGYEKGYGGYGTSWAIFRHKATGKYFGVASSHFSADSVATEEMSGNELRIGDAKTVTLAKGAMIRAATELSIPNAENLPMVFGGDYNCHTTDDPIQQVIALPERGLINARVAVDDADKVDDYATHNSGPSYNVDYDYHPPVYYTSGKGTGKNSIDHIYCYAEGVTFTANQYRIITNLIASCASDHMPHYLDITLH